MKKLVQHQPMQRPKGMSLSRHPIEQERWGITSRPRLPFAEPLSPGLKASGFVQAIGFTAGLVSREDDE